MFSPRHEQPYADRRCLPDGRAFTLVEMLIVIVILGITFAVALPMIGDSKQLRLQEAAKMLVADIEFAQNESITHAEDTRLIKFDTTNDRYWIAAASAPATPITDIIRQEPFLVTFGTGRAAGATNVQIRSVSVGGDDQLGFDRYGAPDQTTNASVTLGAGSQRMIIQIKAGTGEVSVRSLQLLNGVST